MRMIEQGEASFFILLSVYLVCISEWYAHMSSRKDNSKFKLQSLTNILVLQNWLQIKVTSAPYLGLGHCFVKTHGVFEIFSLKRRGHFQNITSVLSPLFNTKLSDTNNAKLEKVQDTTAKIILPDLDCTERLSFLNLCSPDSFIHTLFENQLLKISGDENHLIFGNVFF